MRRSDDLQALQSTRVAIFLLACLLLLPVSAFAAPADDDIVVTDFKGDVHITSAGAQLAPHAGAVIGLPGEVRTGENASIDLRQGATTIGVGPATRLEFPAQPQAGPIDRVSQPAGNAYYSVAPRGPRKLRVETPYLVAVIKGTQFNVAVTDDSSTITLDEGRLEILATDGSAEPVTLNAGEVAVRRKDESVIRVLKVRDAGAPAAGGGGNTSALLDPTGGGDGPGMPGGPPAIGNDAGEDLAGTRPGENGLSTEVEIPTGADVGMDVGSTGAGASLDAGAELGNGSIDTEVDLGAGAGPVSAGVSADATVDLGAGAVTADVDAGVDAGVASVDASVEAGVDLGAGSVAAGVDAGVDAGAISADAGVDAGADLGDGTVGVEAEATVETGAGVGAEAQAAAGADLGDGAVDASVDAGVAGAEAGVDAGIDLTGGDAGVELGVDVLGTETDLGIGGGQPPAEPANPPDTGPVGSLLGGLLGNRTP